MCPAPRSERPVRSLERKPVPVWCGLPRLVYAGPMPLTPKQMGSVGPSHWKTSYVYHVFDIQGDLLYVGFTGNPLGRWEKHRPKAKWWSRASVLHLYSVLGKDRNTSEIAARHWEKLAIDNAQPLFNLHGPATLPAKAAN